MRIYFHDVWDFILPYIVVEKKLVDTKKVEYNLHISYCDDNYIFKITNISGKRICSTYSSYGHPFNKGYYPVTRVQDSDHIIYKQINNFRNDICKHLIDSQISIVSISVIASLISSYII